jgi:hypothetical protein
MSEGHEGATPRLKPVLRTLDRAYEQLTDVIKQVDGDVHQGLVDAEAQSVELLPPLASPGGRMPK